MKLTDVQKRTLRAIMRNPESPLLTQHRQRNAAGLYALGLLNWTRAGYTISTAGLEAIADKVYATTLGKQS